MKNEIEQKKDYLAPKMDIIEIDHQAALLSDSPEGEMDAYFHK